MNILVIFVACLLLANVQSAPTEASKGDTYSVKINDKGVEKEEDVTIDEEKNVEIFKTVDSDDAEIVQDFDAGLEAIVPKNGPCYVKPIKNDENTPPAELKSDIENSKATAKEVEDKPNDYYTLASEPIKKRAVAGEIIREKCADKDIYWLVSVPHGQEGRDKRGCYWFYYCRYYYYGSFWYRRCWYILRCY